MKKSKRVLSLLLSAVMICAYFPQAAFGAVEGTQAAGEPHDISTGSLAISEDGDYTVTGTTTENCISVGENVKATVTLNNVNITALTDDPKPAIDLASGATLTLILPDNSTNTLTGGAGGTENGVAGIHVPTGTTFIIQGSGSLSVTGGTSETGYGGSGIGGNTADDPSKAAEACGTVVILTTGSLQISGGDGLSTAGGDDIGDGRGSPYNGDDGQGIKPTGEDNTYEIWGTLTLPEGVTIPEGAILTGEGSLAEGSKIQQDAPTSAPTVSNISQITGTSITLDSVTINQDRKIDYARVDAGEGAPTIESAWVRVPTLSGLDHSKADTVYARYGDTRFYQASPATPSLTVITAPHTSAVSINYEAETSTYDDQKFEVSGESDFSDDTDFISNGGSITSYVAQKIYVRVKGDDDAPIRGVTEISIPRRTPASSNPQAINVSADGKSDGKITHLTAGTSYQVSTDQTNWTNYTADDNGMISDFSTGDYWVRVKATDSSFKSEAQKVTIGVGNIITIELPTFDSVYAGYTTPDPKPIKIHNSSGEEVTITGVSCTGEVFNIRTEANPNILKVPAGGTNAYYALQPRPGLSPGVHTSTITVTYNGTHTAAATARFTVLPQPTSEDDRGDGGGSTYYDITAEQQAHGKIELSTDSIYRYGDVDVTLTPDKGYEVKDLLINGKSVGAVSKYTIKDVTEDMRVTAVFAETKKAKNDRIAKGVQNTTIRMYYKKGGIGKGWIKLHYKKSFGFKVDNYEIFRSAKKKTAFGKKAWFVTKNDKTKGYYKNGKFVKKGVRYYYKMRGVRKIDGKTYYTKWSNIVMRTGR